MKNTVDTKLQKEAVITLNAQWQITSFSRGAEQLLEIDSKDVLGKDCSEVCGNATKSIGMESLFSSLASGRVVSDFRIVFKKPSSEKNLILLATAIPLTDDKENFTGAIISLQDAADPTLLYRLVLNSIADGVFTVDRDMRITSFNQAAEQITGWTREEVIGKPHGNIFHSVSDESCILAESVGKGVPIAKRSIFINTKDKKTIPISVSAAPLVNSEENIIGGVETFRDITSSIQHDLILDSIADGVFAVDRDMRITAFNQIAEKITGWSSEDVIGKPCSEIFQSSLCGETCILSQSVSEGKAACVDHTVFIKGKKGNTIPINVSSAPIVAPDGTVLGGVETFRDVTRTMTRDLILESIAEGVFAVDRDMRITSFNKRAENITGWTSEEVTGKPCSEIFHSNLCGEGCILSQSVSNGQIACAKDTVFIKHKDGSTIPISISAAPLLDHDGNIIGGVETFNDITASMTKDLLLESIAEGVFAVDRDMQITAFNKGAENITGWTSEEVLGKPCSEVFHSSLCGEECILAQSVTDGKKACAAGNVFIKHKDGKTIPILISAAPLLDHDGNVIGGVETFNDVTASMTKDLILESIADGVFTVDRNWQITSFNRAAEMITGWKREDAIGKSCGDVFHSSICGENCAVAQSLYLGKPVPSRSIFIRDINGKQIPISISASPLMDHEGNIIGGVETFRDLSVLTELRKQLTKRYTFGEIISKSSAMQNIFRILPEIANSQSNVLVLGESGTGKELVANAIHNSSSRDKGPFVAVNCGALPETLLESELFGYKAGAFTDAKKDKQGRFASAEKGTLFLDEIGDIPPSLQVKLLRVLQEKVYEPLGSNRPIKADVRIIAATNRDLQELVRQGSFREDLFYRLNVVKISLPPLRDRKEDIPMLVEHFTKKFSAQQGKDIAGVSEPALNILMRYDFPGNIRELENIIEYSFILCHGGFIQPEHLPEPFAPEEASDESLILAINKPQTLEDIERQAIYQALERNKWKKMATCRELGISKDTLRRKIKLYKLENPLDTLISQ